MNNENEIKITEFLIRNATKLFMKKKNRLSVLISNAKKSKSKAGNESLAIQDKVRKVQKRKSLLSFGKKDDLKVDRY